MPVSNQPIYPQTIVSAVAQIQNSDGTTLKTLFTAGANGSRIENILVSSTDTTNRDLMFYVTVGGTDYLLATIQCPLTSGNSNTVGPLFALSNTLFIGLNTDPNGNKYIYLANGAVLKAKAGSTVTSGRVIQFLIQGGDY